MSAKWFQGEGPNMTRRSIIGTPLIGTLCLLGGASAATAAGTGSGAAEEAAESRLKLAQTYLSANIAAKVKNRTFSANWLHDSERFWYARETESGHEFLLVDATTGEQRPAFDHAALANVLGKQVGADLSPNNLPITSLELSGELPEATITVKGGKVFNCNIVTGECHAGKSTSVAADVVPAPDGESVVFRRDHNLWLRAKRTGEEKQLTHDGVLYFAYGDVDGYVDSHRVERRRLGLPAPLFGVVWSPSGRYVLALRQDLRRVPDRLMVTEYLPPDRVDTVQYLSRTAIARDLQRPDSLLVVIDIVSGETRAVALDPQGLNDWALVYYLSGIVWWNSSERTVSLIGANRGGSRYQLLQIDVASGGVRTTLTETARFNVRLNPYDYARPNVYVWSTGGEAVWYSERDGWGHLYLYDASKGGVKRQLTRGDWVVADLLRVDEGQRMVYFTAVGRERERNPYFRHLYRICLDGGDIELLTPENADHDFNTGFKIDDFDGVSGSSFSPSGRYFVDSYSTTTELMRAIIRDADGRYVSEVVAADDSALRKMGWQPPEHIVAKAADGQTDLYGVIYKPSGFNPNQKYPVIEETYPGPQGKFAPTTLQQCLASSTTVNASALIEPQAFAELGFVVVIIDGRGTAYRSKRFREAYLGTEDVFGAADHVAAMRDLARSRPYMDLNRVGITGESFGGYGSLRAMLLYPEFYKAASSSVGPGSWLNFQQEVSTERFFGVPSDSKACWDYYDVISNTRLVDRLSGKLLLIYAGIDESVPLRFGFELFDALIRADKHFETLVVPNSPHSVASEPYPLRRTMLHFVEHLGTPVERGRG